MWRKVGKRYLKPDRKFHNISEVNLEYLHEQGVKGIIMDLDDTLLPSDNKKNLEYIDAWLKKVKDEFSLFVLSNNSRPDYVKKFCDQFDIPFIARATKPRSKYLIKAIEHMKLDKKEVVIIGDRVTTDILAGKIFGIKAFLVAPLSQKPSKFQRFVYKLEAGILKLIEPVAELAPINEESKENLKKERIRAEINAQNDN